MAAPGSAGSETVDLLYLLAKDYSAFSRNERVQWYADHIVHKDFTFKVRLLVLARSHAIECKRFWPD